MTKGKWIAVSLGLLLTAGGVFAALTRPQQVLFPDGNVYHSVDATASCTTRFVYVREDARFSALAWDTYIASGGGGANDSAAVNVYFQWAYDTLHWDTRWDTIFETFYGAPGDSMQHDSASYDWLSSAQTRAKTTFEEFYPRVCRYLRFKAEGTSDNDDSTYITRLFFLGDDGN